MWKIREAEKGRIPIGPRKSRASEGDFKVVPLRLEVKVVKAIDEARERLGMKSRVELVRKALGAHLGREWETKVAGLDA